MKIIKTKVFKMLIVLLCFGFLFGIISFFLINSSDKLIIKDNITYYINNIKLNNINYSDGIINSIILNIKYTSIIWLCGLIFIFIFIPPLIVIFKGILLSFILFNTISVFGIKGILYALIIFFPCVLVNIIIILYMSYYSINFGIKCYNTIKFNKYINLKDFIKNYFIILIVFIILSIINSIIEIYLVSNILKFVV